MTYSVAITSQGQITIPVDIRRALGLQKGGRAVVRADEGKMVLEPEPDILALRGIFKTKKRIPWSKMRKLLDDAWARGEI